MNNDLHFSIKTILFRPSDDHASVECGRFLISRLFYLVFWKFGFDILKLKPPLVTSSTPRKYATARTRHTRIRSQRRHNAYDTGRGTQRDSQTVLHGTKSNSCISKKKKKKQS